MPELAIATTATSTPMGAQAYQAAITSRAQQALATASPEPWTVRSLVARSLRSDLPGNRRLPMARLFTASERERRLLGRLVWPRSAVVHRMDLILPPPAGPDVVTLHDVVAWEFKDESAPVAAAASELRAADAVICVSQFTAGEAERLLGLKDAVVIPNGVGEEYFSAVPLSPEQLTDVGLRQPYLLYAGGSAARKNLPGLAEAWRLVHDRLPEHSLALAGPRSPARDALFAGLPRVVHLGRLPDSFMPGLVAGAAAVVVPSLYEGFGLPVLEAMAAGVPLLSSNRSSLPEVVANAGTLVDPTGPALAEGMEYVALRSPAVIELVEVGRQRAAEFSWEASAARHASVWASLA
ncbi:group 1 glycosyl transferase [Ornithinimicrobium sp. CNJ-824]|uniref:glycosyltransferase family 4 protein n=1 Tax=Ornithinimicrobium sp. CNJ-824 TaxID=1904966 RepID=UPI000961B974|nr:glycosyltransferase family 1 protein [Ornithinimicrobium sp. CNJ-824]OLT21720.1 group 1 glycosyl transferase [Ornithinimicrobium sp. CNJ-824]